jgi:hypothetical protein
VRFVVLVEGQKFKGRFDGRLERIGFWTTREAEAVSAETIDQIGLFRSIGKELEVAGIGATPESTMRIDRYRERAPEDDNRSFSGFSFGLEDSLLRRIFSRVFAWVRHHGHESEPE